jgi:hypothetical protein
MGICREDKCHCLVVTQNVLQAETTASWMPNMTILAAKEFLFAFLLENIAIRVSESGIVASLSSCFAFSFCNFDAKKDGKKRGANLRFLGISISRMYD